MAGHMMGHMYRRASVLLCRARRRRNSAFRFGRKVLNGVIITEVCAAAVLTVHVRLITVDRKPTWSESLGRGTCPPGCLCTSLRGKPPPLSTEKKNGESERRKDTGGRRQG